MNNLFIIHRTQFGYHTDIYKWCEYLNNLYDIELLCFDEGKDKYKLDNVRIHYIPRFGGKYVAWILFFLYSFFFLSLYKGIIIVSHFKYSRYLKMMMPWRKMILDIRTFSINSNQELRTYENNQLFKSVIVYDYITIISEGLRNMLPKDQNFTAVLPLGADLINLGKKSYDSIDLLYVGTFFNRHLEDTIKGFSKAVKIIGDNFPLSYHIVGFGPAGEEDMLKLIAQENGVQDKVIFHGRQPHNKLDVFYSMCNVGVSYVPCTPYYEYQPVTKTFEYIMAGLYTIATSTFENKKIVNDVNGILIEDNSDAFANALIKIIKERNRIDSEQVKLSLSNYRWEHIILTKMTNILDDYEKKILS